MRIRGSVLLGCVVFIACILASTGYLMQRSNNTETLHSWEQKPLETDSTYWHSHDGDVLSLLGLGSVRLEDLAKGDESVKKHGSGFLRWGNGVRTMAMTALGTDYNLHFVQSFLSNYQPFYTDRLWVPLKTIAMRKSYLLDEKQYKGYKDVWQYSIEAFVNARGDCEDHSLILSDWLISLGYNARLVCGTMNGEGHAWVVLYLDGEPFILEATKKYGLGPSEHYPLASTLPNYKPTVMFDQEFMYLHKYGDRYPIHEAENWLKVSVLKRNVELNFTDSVSI